MIGKLKGVVDSLGEDEAVIEVGGVGYLVQLGVRALSALNPGETAQLHIETYVREDAFKLFGFLSEPERAWFVRLQSVQGVGAKHALSLLDALTISEVENAAALGDASAFERAKGVGKKLAQRIATELKDKAPPVGRRAARFEPVSARKPATAAPAGGEAVSLGASAAREGAVSALINLGYGEGEARQAAALALGQLGDEAAEGALIKAALKELAR